MSILSCGLGNFDPSLGAGFFEEGEGFSADFRVSPNPKAMGAVSATSNTRHWK